MNTVEYDKLYKKMILKADIGVLVWIEIDMNDLSMFIETESKSDFKQSGYSIHQETKQYQRMSGIWQKDEICQNFELYKRDDDGNFIEEENEEIVSEIVTFIKRTGCDIELSQFLFCDENGDELADTQRQDVITEGKLTTPDGCFIIQILGKTCAYEQSEI